MFPSTHQAQTLHSSTDPLPQRERRFPIWSHSKGHRQANAEDNRLRKTTVLHYAVGKNRKMELEKINMES